MTADKPGLEEQDNMPSAEETTSTPPPANEMTDAAGEYADTQMRSDALAADASVPAEAVQDAGADAVENINTTPDNPNVSEDAGELSAPPNAPVVDSSTADAASVEDAAVVTDAVGDDALSAASEGMSDEGSGAGTPDTPEGEFLEAVSSTAPPRHNYKRGDLITGTILRTSPTSVEIDLSGVEGVVPKRELEQMTRQQLEGLREGQEVTVYVVNPNDHKGQVVLSLNRAAEELDWQEAEKYRASQEVYEGNIAGYNKGGLIVRFGRLRGFVPQSQISDDRRRVLDGETSEDRYSAMVNQNITVKVMEVDRSRNRLILSERAASRESREKRKESLINELSVGQIFEGRVVSLEDFGAFVDIGGAEGLVHLTEISWKHVVHPRDVLKVGQKVRVEVISVDRERKRIGLSMKRQEADPWDEIATTYGQGFLVQGIITKLTKFGAFARLVDAPDIEGLIHISELSDQRVAHPREVVEEGEKLTLRVVKVDVKNRRLGLSLKRVNSAEYLDLDMRSYSGGQDSE
ncbi:MAG: S1 RNA-binding domain-containing protein [bacterium]|nr:S1 RNA-binding domain-containing protein [bacterium]